MRLESQDFDNKLKSATANLQHMEREVRRTGATFEYADKEELEFLKSLGSMETKALDSSGKVKELTKSFTELSIVYKNMSDAEKQSAPGQALAGSIDQIKGRIGDLKGQIGEVGQELEGSKGFIDSFADALGQLGPAGQMAGKLLKGAFGPVGIAIAAVVGVIHQLVEAFKRNENAMASAERAAAPFKAIWQQIQRLFDKLVPYIAEGMEKIANVMSGVFNKFTGWIEKLGNTALGKKLGLDKVAEQLQHVAAVQDELTESNKRIADSENALKQARRTTDTRNTQSRAKVAELRFKASDKETYSADERVGFLEAAMKEEEKILQRNLDLRQKEYELIKLKNSLTQSGTEDLDAENAALNAITDAQIEYNEHVRSMQRQLSAARKEAEAEKNAGDKTAAAPVAKDTTKPIKDAVAMWAEYSQKLEDTKARLAEFKAMVSDQSLTDAQRSWAEGMAESYQEQLDKMLGATEETTASITDMWKETLSNMSTGVGAISTIGNAFNDLKGIGEDLTAAFSGEMDAWDSLMTVFNSGISIMQTVIGVMEAINTLTEISSALKKANTIATETEAATAVTAAGTEAGAETVKAAANMTTAGTAAAASSAEAGEAVAGIPIVGPILAVAAIAAVLAATFAAMSKAKSAGKFASGGIVPGNSFSGDNQWAQVNAGELILSKSQQSNVANALTGNNPMGNLRLSTEISGTNLRIVMNNDNRSKGGSRGYYANIH